MATQQAVSLEKTRKQDNKSLISQMIAAGLAQPEDAELMSRLLANKEYEIWSPECSAGGEEALMKLLEEDNGRS